MRRFARTLATSPPATYDHLVQVTIRSSLTMPSLTPPHKLEEMDPQSGVLSKVGPIDKQRAPVLSNTKRDDAKCEVEDGSTPVESYSVFTETAKRTIVGLCTISGLFSPFSAFTYFPALEVMAQDLGVSLQLMNLTITTYLIIQGIAPTILGDLADQIGRRPVYILVLLLFFVANLGLALQRSFAALLVLRMLQSAGSSGRSSTRWPSLVSLTQLPQELLHWVSW